MTISNAMGISPAISGGAILSGVFFGDRCSFMSTSALLVSELTMTDIYVNVKNMMRTSLLPFAVSCALYLVFGMNQKNTAVSVDIRSIFQNNFNLKLIVLLPALLIVVLCAFRVKVKKALIVSIFTASVISLVVQHTSFSGLLRLLLFGFKPPDPQLAAMMTGGGIISMFRVMAIVCISSCYAGIFEGTGLLNGLKFRITWLSRRITAYGSLLVTSVLTCMVACNQTLAIMLTHFLCKDTMDNKEKLAVNMENTVVVIAGLVPWSIACMVPLATVGAPLQSIPAAFYLFLLPLWNFIGQKSTSPTGS